jgi:hypothetical protein
MATERETARRALKRTVEVDERTRPTTPPPHIAYNGPKAWMPPRKFWLAALPGWLPLGCVTALRIVERWQRRRRRGRSAA